MEYSWILNAFMWEKSHHWKSALYREGDPRWSSWTLIRAFTKRRSASERSSAAHGGKRWEIYVIYIYTYILYIFKICIYLTILYINIVHICIYFVHACWYNSIHIHIYIYIYTGWYHSTCIIYIYTTIINRQSSQDILPGSSHVQWESRLKKNGFSQYSAIRWVISTHCFIRMTQISQSNLLMFCVRQFFGWVTQQTLEEEPTSKSTLGPSTCFFQILKSTFQMPRVNLLYSFDSIWIGNRWRIWSQ